MLNNLNRLVAILLILLLFPGAAEATSQALPANDLHHIMFSLETDNQIRVQEVYRWNVADSVPQEPILLNIPSGATDIQLTDGALGQTISAEKLERNGDRVTTPIKWVKGQNEVHVSYNLPMVDGKTELNTQMFYFTKSLYVLAPAEVLNISTNQIQDMGVQSMNSKSYSMFGGADINSGVGLKITVQQGAQRAEKSAVSKVSPSGKIDFHSANHLRNWMNSPLRDTNPHLWLAFVSLLIVGFIIALTYYIRLKVQKQESAEQEQDLQKLYKYLQIRQKTLLKKLADVEQKLLDEPGHEDTEQEDLMMQKEACWNLLRDVKIKLKALESEMGES